MESPPAWLLDHSVSPLISYELRFDFDFSVESLSVETVVEGISESAVEFVQDLQFEYEPAIHVQLFSEFGGIYYVHNIEVNEVLTEEDATEFFGALRLRLNILKALREASTFFLKVSVLDAIAVLESRLRRPHIGG